MRFGALQRRLPRFLWRHILHFEAMIEDSLASFAAALPAGARLLDAGAGEARHRRWFPRQRYVAVDLAVGDSAWDYGKLDAVADLQALPFPESCFDACLNVVTLEHVREPWRVLCELSRVLAPGGMALLVVPQEWEMHQVPHDYYRYTRFGLAYLLEQAGFQSFSIQPAGGFFRLLARRLWNALQFFPWFLLPFAVILAAPPALLLPFVDWLDRERNFTLGYVCTARKRC
jgi:SAM-dependent methyltransferase